MSEINRAGLQLIYNQIGKAKLRFTTLIGDTSKNRAALLDLEKIVVKLRGSTNFHDYDLSMKDPIYGSSQILTYDTLDNVKFGIQGADITVDSKISYSPNTGNFRVDRYSPPCLEGWGVYDYNAWSNYIPQYNSSGLANTNFVIYGSEPSSGSGRTNYAYPVRYQGSYLRVPLFNSAKYFAFKNDTNGAFDDEVHVIMPKTMLDGVYQIDPLTNTPLDLAIYSHQYLYSSSLYGFLTGTINFKEQLDPLAYTIAETNKSGIANTNYKDHYLIKIKLDASYGWTSNYWRYVIFYYGTHDTYFKTSYPVYSSGIANTYDYSNFATTWNSYPKKSFFNRGVFSYLTFDKTGVNDTNVYLYSSDKTHHKFIDGEYSEPVDPLRYKINETIDTPVEDNSLFGLEYPQKDEFIAVSLATRNTGVLYENPINNISVFYTKPISVDYLPERLSDFSFYPSVPSDYDRICNLILRYPDRDTSDTTRYTATYQQILSNCAVVHIDQKADNFVKASIGDTLVMSYLFSPFSKILDNIRSQVIPDAFDTVAYSLEPYIARFNNKNYVDKYNFSDITSNYGKILHNLLKRPIDVLLKNESDAEPKAIQLLAETRSQVADWTLIEPTYNIVSLLSNELASSNQKLSIDSEFEIYQEESLLCEAIDPNVSGNKVGQDYTFRLKFEDSSENYLYKDLYVNASKFFLSDKEYDERLANNLSMVGYYKQSTLNNINDYRLYGYAGLIPDLKMTDSRVISTKVVNPEDNTITDPDYIPNLNKYSNLFVGIDEVGVTVSKYAYTSSPYWINNFSSVVGCTNISGVVDPEAISDINGDSFTIATSGYTTTDGSINFIENICDTREIVDNTASINQLSYNGTQNFSYSKLAIKISPLENTSIKSFVLKLLKTTALSYPYSTIECQLFTNENNLPGTKLVTGSKIYLDNVNNLINDYEFDLFYDLKADIVYWIVLEISKYPEVYDTNTTGLANIVTSSVTGVYDYDLQTYPNFSKYKVNSQIGFGSTNPSVITSWYTISSIGSSTSLSLSSSALTANKQKYIIKNQIKIGVLESTIVTGSPYNLAYYDSTNGWTSLQGTAYIKFFVPTVEVLGTFNRTISGYSTILPPPNQYREDPPNYVVEGYWSYTNKPLSQPQIITIYPRAIYIASKTLIANGILGNNYVEVGKNDLPANIYVGELIRDNSSNAHIPVSTYITSITYNSSTEIYTIYFSGIIANNFINETLTIGENKYRYVKRANDIHLYVRYYQEGKLSTKYILLEKSSNWTTKWYKKTSDTYLTVDQSVKEDALLSSSLVSFSEYDVDGQTEYFNGVVSGYFAPKASFVGNVYTFKIECSGGYRLYLNGSSTPEVSFNNWTNTSLASSTGTITVTTPIEFRLEFTHTTGSQYLRFTFNDGSGYRDIDSYFYEDPEPVPVNIDDEPIEKLAYLVVGKTFEEIDTPTHGAPPGDRLIFRNK